MRIFGRVLLDEFLLVVVILVVCVVDRVQHGLIGVWAMVQLPLYLLKQCLCLGAMSVLQMLGIVLFYFNCMSRSHLLESAL